MMMETEHLNVLLLDDDPADSELIYHHLDDMNGYEVQTYRVANIDAAMDVKNRFPIDLVIVDNCLGFEKGIDAIQKLGGRKCDSAIIMVSGMIGKDIQLAALDAGAINYIPKNKLCSDILEATIRSAIFTHDFESR